jgi:hypothetical protein
MFATIKKLAHWKSEHDEQTCEDASDFKASSGLFAVADGVGTAAFSNIWARIIVQHFLAVPLLGEDPFEVEWWLRMAQEEYRKQAPDLAAMQGAARKKAQEGSYTTLVTLRVAAVEGERVQADLRAFGDSCVLVRRAASGEPDLRFPLEKVKDFERGPVCLPSYLKRFDRHFTRCDFRSTSFAPGDQVLLATDAVAKWVIGGGGRGEAFYQEAFERVAKQSVDEWPAFIQRCRESGQMVDDDVTALVVTFERDETSGAQKLEPTITHAREVCEARKRALEEARQRQDKEAMAIAYGDGSAFGGVVGQLPPEIVEARAVADALNEVRQALRGAINRPDPQAIVGPVWQKHRATLEREVCAHEIIESLRQNGLLTPQAAPPPASPPLFQPLPNVPSPVPGPALPERPRPAVAFTPGNEPAGMAHLPATFKPERQLYVDLVVALDAEDEEQVAAAYEAILKSPVRANIPLKPEQEARAQHAQQRVNALRHLLPQLRHGTPEQKVRAFEYELEENRQWLKPEEREQIRLARDFTEALQDNDDARLWRAYQAILDSPARQTFLLEDYESRLHQIEATPQLAPLPPAKKNLRDLEQAVKEGNLRQIWQVFQALNLSLEDVPPSLRQWVEPAVQFARAFAEDSPQADQTLIQAHNTLFHQPGNRGRFYLEPQDEQRLERARQRQQMPGSESSWEIFGTVNSRTIWKKQVQDLSTLTGWYVGFRQRELGARLSGGADPQDRMELEELNELNRAKSWELLVEDCLIQDGIEQDVFRGKPGPAEFEAELQNRVRVMLPAFRKETDSIPALHHLDEREMQTLLAVFVRRRRFARCLGQRREKLRDWLKKQNTDIRGIP